MKRLRHTDLIILLASAAALAVVVIAVGWFEGRARIRPSQVGNPSSRLAQRRAAEKPRTPADAVPLASMKGPSGLAPASLFAGNGSGRTGGKAATMPSTVRLGPAGAPRASDAPPPAALGRMTEGEWQRRFVMSLCRDLDGNLWVGCEETGVWRFDPSAPQGKRWTQFTTKEGLGDDNGYALACDRLGRIWVGHQNHGVSVYNGERWQNYEVLGGLSRPETLSGPLGERVFAIKVCPIDGDVWMATSAGLARYSESGHAWSYYTRAEGLPSDQANAITFDSEGNIFVASQCDGVVVSDAASGYRRWRQTRAPDALPTEPVGEGLPTNLINDIDADEHGTVYAATDAGLAWSNDRGMHWQFRRGLDWSDKVRRRFGGPPPNWSPHAATLLAEDYIRCVRSDRTGSVWMGYRTKGWAGYSDISRRVISSIDAHCDAYVTAIAPSEDGTAIIATYGSGLLTAPARASISGHTSLNHMRAAKASRPALPKPSHAPKPDWALEYLRLLLDLDRLPPSPRATPSPLNEDWRTQGAWLGRYGTYWACLAAMDSPGDYIWGEGEIPIEYHVDVDEPDARRGEAPRYWIQWLQTTNPKSLELPPTYLDSRIQKGYAKPEESRRQAEWDDHGEGYPSTREGPNLNCTLAIPSGVYYLTIYDVNKDGHTGMNSCRDLVVSIVDSMPASGTAAAGLGHNTSRSSSTRMVDFWGGVYKRYLVCGPSQLTIHVSRNYSLNTILAAVMLDRADTDVVPCFPHHEEAGHAGGGEPYSQATVERDTWRRTAERLFAEPTATTSLLLPLLLEGLRLAKIQHPDWWAVNARAAYRNIALLCWDDSNPSAANAGDLRGQANVCNYVLCFFDRWEATERLDGITPAREIEKALRWDKLTYSNSGRGREVVTQFLSSHPDVRTSGR